MEKPNNSSGEEEYDSCELPNFEVEFFCRSSTEGICDFKRAGVASAGWTQALGTRRRTKKLKQQTGIYLDNFLAIYDNKIQHDLSLYNTSCGIGEQNMKAKSLSAVKSYIRNPSVPKMFKVIVFSLSFNKGSFIKYWWPLMDYFSSRVLVLVER